MLGLENDTSRFMVIVGRVAGFINLFLLMAAAIVFFYLGITAVTGQKYPAFIEDNKERRDLVSSVGPWLIPLALIMLFTVWKVSEMILANRQLSGIMGLAAFIKALLL
jgi:hypothetical protein